MSLKIIIGCGLLILSAVIMIVFLFNKREPFFNLREVIKNHLGLFAKDKSQYVIFYIVPIAFAVGLSLLYSAGAAFYSELSIILGILLSILLAILAIIGVFDFSKVVDKKQKERAQKVLNDTLNAIVFTSVLCLFLLLYGLSIVVVSGSALSWQPVVIKIIKGIISGIAYYIFLVILINLLFIIKQMCKLIEFNQVATKE